MIETGDDLMINEYLTPNMYALTQDSLYCENTLSKNKTNISEFIGLTGSAPTAGVLASRYDYNLPYSLVSQLNNIDYHTMYFHDTSAEPEHDMDLYGREVLMPKLGFDNSYFHEDLFGEDYPMWDWTGNYTFDSITMPIVTDTILQSDEPFFAFYTSLSMHGPYANRSNQKTLEEMYGEKLEYAKENNLWRNPLEIYAPIDAPCVDTYMMCAMDFDKALGEMFERFEEEGKLDDTLFVIKSLQKQFETIKNKSWCKRMIALMTLSLLARLSKEQNEVKQDIIQSLKKLKVFPLTTEKTILRVKIKLCLINISPWLFMRLV